MAVRLTGMVSGLDTESLIKGMVDAQRLKNKRVTDKQTLLTWKQEKWKELNTKLYKLYTDDLSKMRLQSSFLTKKVTTSNDNLVEISGGTTAPTGAHSLVIDKLANSQYVTGAQLGTNVTASTTLKDLGMVSSTGNDMVILIKNGDKENQLTVTNTTTLTDFVNACKEVGLSAGFDTTQKRLFISSKESGTSNTFSITAGEVSSTGMTALNNIKSIVNYNNLSASEQNTVIASLDKIEGLDATVIDTLITKAKDGTAGIDATEQSQINAIKTLITFAEDKAKVDARSEAIINVKEVLVSSIANSIATIDMNAGVKTDIENEIQSEIDSGSLPSSTDQAQLLKERYAVYESIRKEIDTNSELEVPDGIDRDVYVNSLALERYQSLTQSGKTTIFNKLVDDKLNSVEGRDQVTAEYNSLVDGYIQNAKTELETNIQTYAANATTSGSLSKIGLDNISGDAVSATTPTGMTVIAASDAQIILNGAVLTSSTNTVTANGFTIDLKGKTAVGETINFTVSNNTQANYDMVKNFIKSYNEILKEMNDLYFASSSKGYNPLSDDEKEAMTESQIDRWETKIKGSILRRDSNLGSLLEAMKNTMMSSVKVGDKSYSLSNFGIGTSSDYTEKGLLHINGNADDALFAGISDKLMKAFEEDPDTVTQVFTEISKNLYSTMTNKMKSIPNVSSAFTFYNDKLMDNQQKEYKKKITTLESKLVSLENKYYKQFAALETAMSKLQSQTNALAGLLGTSQN